MKHYAENFNMVAFNNLQLKINAESEGNKNGVKIYYDELTFICVFFDVNYFQSLLKSVTLLLLFYVWDLIPGGCGTSSPFQDWNPMILHWKS